MGLSSLIMDFTMNNQQTKQNLNEAVTASVKALKLAILLAQRAVAADANRVMLMLYLSIGQFVSQKSRNERTARVASAMGESVFSKLLGSAPMWW